MSSYELFHFSSVATLHSRGYALASFDSRDFGREQSIRSEQATIVRKRNTDETNEQGSIVRFNVRLFYFYFAGP